MNIIPANPDLYLVLRPKDDNVPVTRALVVGWQMESARTEHAIPAWKTLAIPVVLGLDRMFMGISVVPSSLLEKTQVSLAHLQPGELHPWEVEAGYDKPGGISL